MNTYFYQQQQLRKQIAKIPKKNKLKFYSDLLILIEKAQGDNYGDYDLDF